MAKLALIVPLTIGLIFILLYTAFNSLTYVTLIIANVPFTTIGGVIGLFITGQYLSVPSAIGFIAVFGVAMLNGIVLASFLNDQRERDLSVREAVKQGAALRLRPVLMTASIAIFGLVPMLLSSGVGAETQRPLATVVVGGHHRAHRPHRPHRPGRGRMDLRQRHHPGSPGCRRAMTSIDIGGAKNQLQHCVQPTSSLTG